MIIEYRPEGGTAERYDAERLRVSEVQIVERTADRKWAQIQQGLREDDATAMRTVVFVIKKRSSPALRLAEFDPYKSELRTLFDGQEVASWVKRLMQKISDPEQLAKALEELTDPDLVADTDEAAHIIADLTGAADAPKAPAPPAAQA
ncbi:hypothetical protein [Streptomyces chryseus]